MQRTSTIYPIIKYITSVIGDRTFFVAAPRVCGTVQFHWVRNFQHFKRRFIFN